MDFGWLVIRERPQLSIWIDRQYLWEEARCEGSIDECCVARIAVEVIGYCHKSQSVTTVPSSVNGFSILTKVYNSRINTGSIL